MAYAPILDSSAYTSAMEDDRQLSLAAAAELQRMAAGDATVLRQALEVLATDASAESVVASVAELVGTPDAPQRNDLVEQRKALLQRLVDQLRQVKAFGELDSDHVGDYIGPVGRLIRSGRVELFAGTPPSAR